MQQLIEKINKFLNKDKKDNVASQSVIAKSIRDSQINLKYENNIAIQLVANELSNSSYVDIEELEISLTGKNKKAANELARKTLNKIAIDICDGKEKSVECELDFLSDYVGVFNDEILEYYKYIKFVFNLTRNKVNMVESQLESFKQSSKWWNFAQWLYHLYKNDITNVEGLNDMLFRYASFKHCLIIGNIDFIINEVHSLSTYNDFDILYGSISMFLLNSLESINDAIQLIEKGPLNSGNMIFRFWHTVFKLRLAQLSYEKTFFKNNYIINVKEAYLDFKSFIATHESLSSVVNNQELITNLQLRSLFVLDINDYQNYYNELDDSIKQKEWLIDFQYLYYREVGDYTNALKLAKELYDKEKSFISLQKVFTMLIQCGEYDELEKLFLSESKYDPYIVAIYLTSRARNLTDKGEDYRLALYNEAELMVGYFGNMPDTIVYFLDFLLFFSEARTIIISKLNRFNNCKQLPRHSMLPTYSLFWLLFDKVDMFKETLNQFEDSVEIVFFLTFIEQHVSNYKTRIGVIKYLEGLVGADEQLYTALIRFNVLENYHYEAALVCVDYFEKGFEICRDIAEYTIICAINTFVVEESIVRKCIAFLEAQENYECHFLISQFFFKKREYSQALQCIHNIFTNLGGSNLPIVWEAYIFTFLHAKKGIQEELTSDTVKGNTVVTLANESSKLVVCLDTEYIKNEDEKIFDILFLSQFNKDFISLLNKQKKEEVSFNQQTYIIESIEEKYLYVYRAVMQRHHENKAFMNLKSFSLEEGSIQEVMNSVVPKYDKSKEEVMKRYYDSELGAPLNLISRDIPNYIKLLRHLILDEGQGLLVGTFSQNCDLEKKYVLTFSTIVILCILDELVVIDYVKENIIISSILKSTIYEVLMEEIRGEKDTSALARNSDEEVLFVEVLRERASLESIYSAIKDIPTEKVTKLDYESIMKQETPFEIISDIDKDELFLAHCKGYVYVTEDKFLRTLAIGLQIETSMLISLLNILPQEIKERILNRVKNTNYMTEWKR